MTVLDLLVHPVVVGLVVIVVASGMMGLFSSKQHFPVEGRTVLLTGGSSGMGRALAKKLAEQGANVCIVARNQQKLDETIDYIKSHSKSPNQRFLAISADCTSATENTRILDETTTWNNSTPPDIIWANAGSSSPGLFIDTPLETHRAQMDMNYWSSFYLAHASLKLWLSPSSLQDKKEKEQAKRAEPRHFIITSSVVAFVGLAGYTPYAPAKAALKSLADSLRMELNLYSGSRQSSTHPSLASEVKIHLSHSIYLCQRCSSRALQRRQPKRKDVVPLIDVLGPYVESQRSGKCSAAEINEWSTTADGGLRAVVRNTIRGLVRWSSQASIDSLPYNYTHKTMIATLEILGADEVLAVILDELKSQTLNGSGSAALEIATTIVCAPLPVPALSQANALMQFDQSAPAPVNQRRTLRQALQAQLGEPKALLSMDTERVEAL
ncbi:NAD(P)-binding protein, partial [Aureobasidium pullulans]